MGKCRTPTFIAEFQLRTTPADERALRIRLDAGRNIYNAALGEALRRLDLMRESRAYQAASKLPRGNKTTPEGNALKRARDDAFNAIRARHQFGKASIVKFTTACRNNCWIKDHLGSQEAQATARRAFDVVNRHAFSGRNPDTQGNAKTGKKARKGKLKFGRPRFRGKRFFHSVENQCIKQGLRFKDGILQWGELRLPIRRDPHDKDGWQAEALARRVKYARVIRRELRGLWRWYLQLSLEGVAPQRRLTGEGAVGLDIGPSTIGMYSDTGAAFDRFCPTVTQPWKKTRRLQRAMDRSRRATNPECFNPNRTWKKGAKATVRSRRYQALALKRRERDRRLASERKRSHGQLANAVLGRGSEVRLEKLSYKAWQKTFGRSVTVRGAGGFVAILKRKLQALDGNLVEINPYETALSQFDHTTGEYVKKPLKRRVHYFGDGTTAPVHRDLYSAFLARHCGCENLDVPGVIDAWPRAEQLVRRAMLLLNAKGRPIRQAASDKTGNAGASSRAKPESQVGFILPQAFRRLRAGRLSKVDGQSDENVDVVACGKLHAGAAGSLAKGARKRPQAPPEPRIFGNTLGSRLGSMEQALGIAAAGVSRKSVSRRRGDVPFPYLGVLGVDVEGAGMFRR